MRPSRRVASLLVLLLPLAAAAKTIYVLERLTPDVPKKPPAGYAVDGPAWSYRDARVGVLVTPLDRQALDDYYRGRGIGNPFARIPPEENYVFFKVRIENFQKEDYVEFSPGSCMFGNSNVVDEIAVYQLFYKERDGEALLAEAGKTLFLRNLRLPAGEWIERLMVFQYDDPYKTRRIGLILSSILLGREGLDIEFPFRAEYRKEKPG